MKQRTDVSGGRDQTGEKRAHQELSLNKKSQEKKQGVRGCEKGS